METSYYKSTGWSLIIGSLLAMATMLLHPAGGSLEHILQMATPIKQAHTLAIISLPFILYGFYGLTLSLNGKWKSSTLGFIVISLGLIAAMLAAMFNGLILPDFLETYSESIVPENETLQIIVNYGFAINRALDFVFIVAFCLSIALYSVLIFTSEKLPKFIGLLGMTIFVLAGVGVITSFDFISLLNFRIFIFSIAAWILFAGRALITLNNKTK